uniref:DNA 3'-5' helicase n=1 Tax=Nannospalax galili TaxID=1026970 RepID=A0A8C6RPV3_NANGA
MVSVSALMEELKSVTDELHAIDIQMQELTDWQQELLQRKSVLTRKIKQHLEDSDAGANNDCDSSPAAAWNKEDFPLSGKVKDVLRNVFKLQKFRPLQLETINVTMAGKEVLIVMPTGGGKSLCYQLPALCSDGFTLVICPLISLMEEQLMLNASSSKEHVKWVHAEMVNKNSQLKLIYVTPEKIVKSKMFMSRLEKAFEVRRPDYKALGILKWQFPNTSLIGLTVTMTNHVLKDKPSGAEDFIEDIVKLINGWYQRTVRNHILFFSDSEQVTISLQKLGIRAGAYHANMEPEDKTKVHIRWSANELWVLVATVAFGMGIDKPDVRFVIHHSMSKSMENYYQESGCTDCISYYGFGDIFRISSMVVMEKVEQQKLYEMVSYCQNMSKCCVLIAQHFDEVWNTDACNKMCDNYCKNVSFEKKNITQHCPDLVRILQQAEELNEKLTPLKLIDPWMGKGTTKLRVGGGTAPGLPGEDLEKIVAHVLLQQYLKEDYSFTAYATVSYLKVGPKAHLLNSEAHVVTVQVKKPVRGSARASSSETCQSEQADEKGEGKHSGSFQKSANTLQPSGSKSMGAKKRKLEDARVFLQHYFYS